MSLDPQPPLHSTPPTPPCVVLPQEQLGAWQQPRRLHGGTDDANECPRSAERGCALGGGKEGTEEGTGTRRGLHLDRFQRSDVCGLGVR